MKKKIFISGSSGFIGFHLSKSLLSKGIKVHGYDSMNNYYDLKLKKSRLQILKKYKNFTFTKNTLENMKILKRSVLKFKPNFIIHLAAQAGVRYSIDEPRKFINSNIIGTYNILELSQKLKVKHLIIASSSSVYGSKRFNKSKEIDKTDNQLSIYAATKKSSECIAHSYSSLWNIPTTLLRFFTVYGPWGRPDMAYFKFTKSIIENKKIDVYNKGKMFRDLIYIDDVVKSLEILINKPPKIKKFQNDSLSDIAPFRIVNIGNQKKIYLKKFINEIEKQLKKKAKKNFLSMQKGDVRETLSNSNLLYEITKFKPKINYKLGISKFISWYKVFYS
tara:strand:- start:2805 stop:3803 length:999 start_codon:yes stop_codon:yes gene_type:complete